MNLKKTLKNEKETIKFAREIAESLKGKTVLMYGNLGAGKTFLVKAVADYFNCPHSSSPTFTIHQRYTGDIPINHFDLYRLQSVYELDTIGFYEFLENGETCFIEWADRFNLKDELENYTEITITIDTPEQRTVTVTETHKGMHRCC
jgi:tRNA threonylcarbamoyladenosine biosynthesis protein TsaE